MCEKSKFICKCLGGLNLLKNHNLDFPIILIYDFFISPTLYVEIDPFLTLVKTSGLGSS